MSHMPFWEARNISKSFYGTKALDSVSVHFNKGEIVGVIGENGAGKSTLMKILSGEYTMDEGEILIEGQPVSISSPAIGRKLGIRMVYQDMRLVPDLPVYQNILLTNEAMYGPLITDEAAMRQRCKAMLDNFGIEVEILELVRNLTVAQKQLVEIAKALIIEPRMLILDEPTSALTPAEVEQLFKIVRDIRASGVTVVFISHRIAELLEICDRFVVLRDGVLVGKADNQDIDSTSLIKMMVGRDILAAEHPESSRERKHTLLSVENLASPGKFHDIHFNLYKGEILGVYGIDGNGQREMLQAICGCGGSFTGQIRIHDKPVHPTSPSVANAAGISFLTNDRLGKNVFMSLQIAENIRVPNLKQWTKHGILNETIASEKIEEGLKTFNVKYNSASQLLRELSGGNQQKVAISARTLQHPSIFIFDEPTIGIDVGSKSEIYAFLRQLTEQGIGVIILSSDMTEIMQVSDRVLVMSNGALSGEFSAEEITEEKVGAAAILGNAPQSVVCNETQQKPTLVRRKIRFGIGNKWMPSFGVLLILVLMGIVGGTQSNTFLKPYSIGLILWQCLPLVLTAMAQNLVIMAGGIDLSLGSVLSLTTCVMSYILIQPGSAPLAIALVLFTGLLCGIANALLVVHLRIPHFIATLATQITYYGIALTLRPTAGGRLLATFTNAAKTKIGVIPIMAIVLLVLVILFEVIMQRTKFGRYIYATGSNREAAYSSGINVVRIRSIAYIAAAALAAAAGFLLGCRIGCGDPNAGATFSIQSIASAVIGGTVMSGGRGTLTGSALGALLITVLSSFLNMIGISSYWQYVWQGGLILISVIIHFITDQMSMRTANADRLP